MIKKYRFIIAVGCVILSLIILSFYFENWRVHKQLQQRLQQHVAEVNKQLERLLFFPSVLANDPRLVALLESPNQKNVKNINLLLNEIQYVSGAAFVYVLDPNGMTLAASNADEKNSFVGQNYNFRPYFKQAISGQSSTFYAVGSTTYAPGYFIANPIYKDQQVLGVIVVKIHLDSLSDSWDRLDYDLAVFDELDVAILSNREDFLYIPYGVINQQQQIRILDEQRYKLNRQARFEIQNNKLQFIGDKKTAFLTEAQTTYIEPWTVRLFYLQSRVWSRFLTYCSAILAASTIILLLVRTYQQQRLIVNVERIHAEQLEQKVAEQTQQLKDTQQQLIVQSNYAMLGKMSAAINHEINQPLASLRFNLASLRQLLEAPSLQLDEIRQISTDSDLTTKRISRVMETLRSVSKTSNINFENIDLNQLLKDSINTVNRERPNISKHLEVKYSGQTISVIGNFVLLQQALLNLLFNAFDAILQIKQPMIVVGISCDDQWARLTVKDNGVGISGKMTSELFDEYATSKSGNKGLGLGLALSSQIAQDHDGRLRYDPVQTGGSLFSILLRPNKS